MDKIPPLALSQLYRSCEPELLPFKSTVTLEKFTGFFGQERALEAMNFGVGMRRPGYNFFIMGNPHTGRFSFAMDHLKSVGKKDKKPSDWCYLNNFEDGRAPTAIRLAPGKAVKLKKDNQSLLEAIATELPAAYENPNFQRKKSRLDKEFNALYDNAIDEVEEEARKYSIALYRDAGSIGFTPVVEGQAMDEAQFSQLPDDARLAFSQNISYLEDFLNEALTPLPIWRREATEKLKRLEKDTALQAIEPLMVRLKEGYADTPKLLEYYAEMLKHIAKHADEFLNDEKSGELLPDLTRRAIFQECYGINLFVDNNKTKGAPVIYEAHPTYENLFGRIEYSNDMGSLTTSYQKIQAGALHKANGGYLLLDAEKLLEMPHVYSALKRALKSHEVRIENPTAELAGVSPLSQSPAPIQLSLKIALVGSRNTYYLLQELDPDFEKAFRVVVDFDEEVERTPQTIRNYARLMKTLSDQEGLAPFTRAAIARLVEHSSREAGDQNLLSSHIGNIVDLLCEADYKRSETNDEFIQDKHIDFALDAQQARTGRLSQKIHESILNNVVLIDTEGSQVGKLNGLTVLQVGDVSFGTPARITATVYPGEQGILDIEREADLGQSIHSKGVLILSGYLGYKYAKGFPIKISANIAMEQSYGSIDGDSASLAEVCALISSLTRIPVSQSFAITGSINQYGEVQAIGGVNEKIEGFFEICKKRSFQGGGHGVIIPKANIRNLMLKHEVLSAVESGDFSIHAVESVDQCLELLMDQPVGVLENDLFEEGSVNASVVSCFESMAKIKA